MGYINDQVHEPPVLLSLIKITVWIVAAVAVNKMGQLAHCIMQGHDSICETGICMGKNV